LRYQWIGEVHAVTFRDSYIYKKLQLDATFFGFCASANSNNHLRNLNVSAAYIYEHTISVTRDYLQLTGSPDPIAYANNAKLLAQFQRMDCQDCLFAVSQGRARSLAVG
jgi:hypothetical protein